MGRRAEVLGRGSNVCEQLGVAAMCRCFEQAQIGSAPDATGCKSRLRRVPDRAVGKDGEIYRSVASVLDHKQAKASDLAKLYRRRSENETSFDEVEPHLRGARLGSRSKTPDLVRQDFYGTMLAHFVVRGLMHEAALQADEDPDRLSFAHSLNFVRRKASLAATLSPSMSA